METVVLVVADVASMALEEATIFKIMLVDVATE